jgi:peptide/nickel transport system ATP-binding protein/oligopeptide transport system ATP-binding protein
VKKLVEVVNLKKYFKMGRNRILKAVNDVSIHIYQGETLGVVGESGCGKTTLGRVVVRLYQPTGGNVLFEGLDVHKASGRDNKRLFRRMQMIFQDPYASLNPRMAVGEIIGEALDIHHIARGSQRRVRIMELLKLVGLNAGHAGRFPHEFSSGQRQRIGIARALAVEPEFIVCDEPVSALDVSIQAQVVNLLEELQESLGLTYMFIAHDLSMVRHISSRVAVMYLGRLVELAGSEDLYQNPLHPYTQALLSSIPVADPDIEAERRRIILAGDVPDPVNPLPGCAFVSRCPQAVTECREEAPVFREIARNHFVACHRAY